jgi:hypothetical protein
MSAVPLSLSVNSTPAGNRLLLPIQGAGLPVVVTAKMDRRSNGIAAVEALVKTGAGATAAGVVQ